MFPPEISLHENQLPWLTQIQEFRDVGKSKKRTGSGNGAKSSKRKKKKKRKRPAALSGRLAPTTFFRIHRFASVNPKMACTGLHTAKTICCSALRGRPGEWDGVPILQRQ